MSTTPSYRDLPGLTNRANSALIRIDMINQRTDLSSGARLVLIAKVMADEPVLTDDSTAAYVVQREAAASGEYKMIKGRVRHPSLIQCPTCGSNAGEACTVPTDTGRRPVTFFHAHREYPE